MKYIGKYKGNVGTTHGTLVSGLVGYYNRIINLSKYLIGGLFTTYLPNVNLLDDYKNSILIVGTHDGFNYEWPPLNGLTTNILVTIDNSTQIDPEFSVNKIRRLNSGVNQMDFLALPTTFQIAPGKTLEMSFWYYGTYGTNLNLYSFDTEIYVERWDASTNAYITNNSKNCDIPVTTNTWQYIQVRARNTHATLNKTSPGWMILHSNSGMTTLSNTEYWKITCLKSWYVESVTKNKIIRLNDDGSVDNTWYNNSSYTSGDIQQLIYNNRKIYTAMSSTLDGGLVRFNLDGTKDNLFNIGTGFNGDVRNVIIDNTNSKIYAGGNFTTFKGSTQNRIIRLNMDGSKDNTFNIGTGFNNNVLAFNVDTINQKIYAGGDLTMYNGTTQKRLARLNLDGSLDTNFNIGTGFDGAIISMIIDTINQKIYVGGAFTTFNGSTQNKLIRLNMNGTKDTSFNIGDGFNNNIFSINLDNINQKLYVGGNFTTFNGTSRNRLVRLNMDGSLDTNFNIGTGFDSYVEGFLIDNEKNKIYILGSFTKYNNQQQKYIARLNMNGSLDNTFNIQLNSSTRAMLKYTE